MRSIFKCESLSFLALMLHCTVSSLAGCLNGLSIRLHHEFLPRLHAPFLCSRRHGRPMHVPHLVFEYNNTCPMLPLLSSTSHHTTSPSSTLEVPFFPSYAFALRVVRLPFVHASPHLLFRLTSPASDYIGAQPASFEQFD